MIKTENKCRIFYLSYYFLGKIIRTKSVLNDSLQSPKKSKGFQLTKYMFFDMLNNLLIAFCLRKQKVAYFCRRIIKNITGSHS